MSNSAVSIPKPVVSDVRKKDADYVFYELTRSICPNCKKVIDAKILLRDNKVFMAKRCPDCGPFEALIRGRRSLHEFQQVQQARHDPACLRIGNQRRMSV